MIKFLKRTKSKKTTNQQQPIRNMSCPLCGSTHYIILQEYPINTLIDRWNTRYSYNPFPEEYFGKILERRVCRDCGMHFYNYWVPDTKDFYKKLSGLHTLYSKNKWDYDEAIAIVQKYKPNSLLDIGCGFGYFIDKIQHFVDRAVGSEFNPVAIETCRSKNIDLYTMDLKQIQEKFDMVTAFQVFEHVKDSKTFVENCLNLLNKDGLLLFVTPNPQSVLIKYNPGLLELPPHHCCDISKAAYEYIAQKYNLEILEYKEQELEFWVYCQYLAGKYGANNRRIHNDEVYRNYLLEKDNLIGKSHFVLYKKS